MAQDLIFPNSKLVGGRNFSIGFNADYYVPFVSASAGGGIMLVRLYRLRSRVLVLRMHLISRLQALVLGILADMRLYKNIFLMAGVNFTQVKYKNTFNRNTTFIQPYTKYEYLRGDVQNSYTEDYTHTMIEVPIFSFFIVSK